METRRLGAGDEALASELMRMMAEVFEEDSVVLSDAYLRRLLSRQDFWALAAIEHGSVLGGVTAHVLPMTRSESSELFIYDLAVRVDRQRGGIGRALISALLKHARDAGIETTFVPADNDDTHALEFYRALGGEASPVTFFTFSHAER